jgi:ABC-2 type transport system permease protein
MVQTNHLRMYRSATSCNEIARVVSRAAMSAVTEVYRSRELLWNLTLRELRTKYRRSFLGWTWSMLNPLATVAIYGVVFGLLFGVSAPVGEPSGLDNFALFLVCGILPWNFFALMNTLGMGAISANAGLVRRVYFPRETLVFSNVLHACVQFGIEMTILGVILVIAGSFFVPWLPVVVVTSVLLAMFGTGFALALSVLSVYFRDMSYLWGIVMQAWFFATPIVYPPSLQQDALPGWAYNILSMNPMARFVEAYRSMMYGGGAPDWTTIATLAVVSVATLTLGWAVFAKMSRRLPEEV